jgi:hypothetical protein
MRNFTDDEVELVMNVCNQEGCAMVLKALDGLKFYMTLTLYMESFKEFLKMKYFDILYETKESNFLFNSL